ncbi:MAG: HAD-IA family hydrolase [Synergistaceae bacterium]|nr:HAD-IA family hydrolase [Synergistaceae bacterium]
MIELMIFDHDMTIVDSSYSIMAGFNYVAEHEGLPKVSHELTMKYIAAPIPEFCRGLLGDYKPEWIKLYREATAENEGKLIKPFEDTVPTLLKLHEMNIKTAVVSNREKPSYALKNTGLDKYFSVIVGAKEPYGALAYKPEPAMINALLEDLKISRENAIYIGDSDIDIQTAINANVRSVGITKGNFNAEDFAKLGAWKVIDSLSELIEIAETENS